MLRLKQFFGWVLPLLTLLALTAGTAHAALKDVGPINPANGFPIWYRDASSNMPGFPQGLPLEQCISQTPTPGGGGTMCALLPEFAADGVTQIFFPDQPIVFPTNFPSEIFWWAGAATIAANPTGITGILDMGLEGAFGAGPVTVGDQVSFARIRLRIDIPAGKGGTYRITHPFGVKTFSNVGTGTRAINDTEDLGLGAAGQFGGALEGRIGPFLVWTPDGTTNPDGTITIGTEIFVGNPDVVHTVTGSPFNTNFFRIERLDAAGNVIESTQTNLFSITGKIYTTPIPTPVSVKRAIYSRTDAATQIDVFATAGITSNQGTPSVLQLSAAGLPPVTMNTDGLGNFYVHRDVPAGTALPNTVTITNISDNAPVPVNAGLIDDIIISTAYYNAANQSLTIQAASSDKIALPTLIAEGAGLTVTELDAAGNLLFSNLQTPPPAITIVSSAGGSHTEPVHNFVKASPPVAVNDLATTVSGVPVTINVLANDVAVAGALAPATVAIVTPPASGIATVNPDGTISYGPTSNFTDSVVTFTYTVADTTSSVSLPATVTVNITAPPIAVNDTATVQVNKTITINILSNDTAIAPAVINPSTVVLSAPTGGTATVDIFGIVTYTAPATAGTYTFTYTVKDNSLPPQTSNTANVTVTVPAPGIATGVTATAIPVSPQTVGTQIAFSSAGEGGTGQYEYQLWVRNPITGNWVIVQPYSTNPFSFWNTTGWPAGIYNIQVWVRNAGSTANYEAWTGLTYTLSDPNAATSVSILSVLPASPSAPGSTVTFNALAAGGSGTYEYQLWVRDPASGNWSIVQGYPSSSSLSWDTTGLAAGTYAIQVWARNAGSGANYEAWTSMTYELQ